MTAIHDDGTARELTKVPTGVVGLDRIALGGIPENRTTLVLGAAGAGKSLFATHFLAAGITDHDANGVFVTFEERPEDIRLNNSGFGLDIAAWEAEGRWAFVDASPRAEDEGVVVGQYDFGGLIARVEHAVRQVDAKRVAIDSLGSIFGRYSDAAWVRVELLRLSTVLKSLGVTAVLTLEQLAGDGGLTRFGVEEFVGDNVVVLRNREDSERRRRTVEVLKFRGASHRSGEFPFTIVQDRGIEVIPLSGLALAQGSSDLRVTSGNHVLDEMCGGEGFFRDSVVLVSGATGTGKTLLVTEFLAGGVAAGERCMVFAFEESRDQLFRNAAGWGHDFGAMEAGGRFKVVCEYPETASLEDHLVAIRRAMDEFQPDRVAVDSLSALARVGGDKGFREFIIGLTGHVKGQDVAGLLTSTSGTLLGGLSITDAHISTLTDAIILLRYVELYGEIRRGLTVLKMRGSSHDKQIREFTIDGTGMTIGKPFSNVVGILAGAPTNVRLDELDRVDSLFEDGGPGAGDG